MFRNEYGRGAAALLGTLLSVWEGVKVGKIAGYLGMDKAIEAEKYQWLESSE